MNHQPFESWLLDDKPIAREQRRELELHVRSCASCSALMETGRVLRSARMAAPAPGFASRFEVRLAARRLADRRRRFWGGILFTLGGLGLFVGLSVPLLASFFSSPAGWISVRVEWGIFFITTLQAVSEAGSVLVRVLPGFLSPFGWMVLLSAAAGMSLLWSISIWRFAQRGLPRGV